MAEETERRHDHVLHLIDEITAPTSGVSPEIIALNFEEVTYKDAKGELLFFNERNFTLVIV